MKESQNFSNTQSEVSFSVSLRLRLVPEGESNVSVASLRVSAMKWMLLTARKKETCERKKLLE